MEEKYTFADREAYLAALDSVLPASYIQSRELGGGKIHKYYPLAIQQAVADAIFQYWNVIDCQYVVIANEIVATVKIIYMPSYPGASEYVCSGSAASPIQMTSGSSVTDFPAKKISNALEYNVPSVRSRAVGNALNDLGNVFGRNIERKINKTQSLEPTFSLRNQFNKKPENKK